MKNRIILNLVLLFATFVLPVYFLYANQESIILMKKIQVPLLLTLFVGSLLLFFANYKFKKEIPEQKILWIVFEMIGAGGFLYSGFLLLLLYSFRDGIGF